MPEFRYKVKDHRGRSIKGVKFASSRSQLILELEREKLTVVSIVDIKEEKRRSLKARLSEIKFGRGKVRIFELVILCKQLATMLHGGVPILNAMESIAGEMKNPAFRKTLGEVSEDLRSGKALSEGLRKHPEAFSILFTSIVEAGEKVGSLDQMLQRLSGYLESRDRLTRKMRSATAYPAVIAIFFVGAVSGITLFLIPRFQSIYEDFGAELPALTSFIFKTTNFLIDYIAFVLFTLVAFFFGAFYFFTKTRKGKFTFDKMLLKLPLFGDAIRKAAVSKFCRTLSTLLEQGIPIAEALLLVGRTSGNIVVEEGTNKASKLIVEGETIPVALGKMGVFPALMLQMTTVGVESGALPELLDKTADFYEEQVDTFVSNLTTMIEPILVVSLGAVIAVVVIALYMPIFKLGTAAMGGGR